METRLPVDTTLSRHARRVAENCIAHRLRLLTRVVSRRFNAELENSGVTVSQFNILTFLLNRPGAAPSLLADALELEKSSVSRNVELMRKNGWIAVRLSGRRQSLEVTPSGNATYAGALVHWQQAQDRIEKSLGTDIARELAEMAETLRKSEVSDG